MILYISTMVLENKWNLIFIKNIFGEKVYNFIIKLFTYSGKYNRIWMLFGWIILMIVSLVALYIYSFLFNNMDIIGEILYQTKPK
jgi:hypothetical protein